MATGSTANPLLKASALPVTEHSKVDKEQADEPAPAKDESPINIPSLESRPREFQPRTQTVPNQPVKPKAVIPKPTVAPTQKPTAAPIVKRLEPSAPVAPAKPKPLATFAPVKRNVPAIEPVLEDGSPSGVNPEKKKVVRSGIGAPTVYEADEVKVEDRVIALDDLMASSLEPTKIWRDFVTVLLPKITLRKVSRGVLENFSNIDVTAERVTKYLKENPFYEGLFLRVVESLSKREDKPSTEAAFVLMGMQNSRNFVLALQASRTARGVTPSFGPDGKLSISPSEVLRYALLAESQFKNNKSGESEMAFAAGLLFDYLNLTIEAIHPTASKDDQKKIAIFIQAIFDHGLRTAKIANEISGQFGDFSLKKYLFSTCLLHDVGKAVLAILDPGYLSLMEQCQKKELPRELRHFAEKTKYGVDHAILGSVCCFTFKALRPMEKAILFHHEPYLAKRAGKSGFQLAALVCMATNIANSFKRVDAADDPILQKWKGMELKDFQIDMKKVTQALYRVTI